MSDCMLILICEIGQTVDYKEVINTLIQVFKDEFEDIWACACEALDKIDKAVIESKIIDAFQSTGGSRRHGLALHGRSSQANRKVWWWRKDS